MSDAAKAADTVLTDAKGRKLTIRGISLVEQYRLAKAVGSATAQNEVAWSMAQTAASVRDIDGVPLMYPTSDPQVELNIVQIGDEGYAAFVEWLRAETAKAMASAKAAGDAGPLETSAASSGSQA